MKQYYKSVLNIVCWLLLLSSSPAISQDIQLAGFSLTRFPGAGVKDSGLNQKLEVNEYNFFLNLPRQLKNDKTILIHGLQYRLVTPVSENDLHLGLDGQNLHLLGYRLTVLHGVKNDWRILVSLNPTLSSTFSTTLEGDDFLLNGALQFFKRKSERLSYGVGVAYLSTFGEPRFIPTIQIRFKSEKDQLQVLLPRHIRYDHYFGKLTAGFRMEASGSRYNVNFTRTNSLNDIEPIDKVAYSRLILGPTLSYRVGKAVQLEASGGYTVARRVEFHGDLVKDGNYEINNGPFFRFGIAIVPSQKNK